MQLLVVEYKISHMYITNYCIWRTCVTWKDTNYELPEDDTIESKYVGVW